MTILRPSRLGLHLATVQRAAQVARTLSKFGFGELVRQTPLDRFVNDRGASPGDDSEADAIKNAPLPARVRMLLEELGPTFIKAGQVMSTRPDLIPTDWIEELAKLQADVPPEPWSKVQPVLREELGSRLDDAFDSIDEEPMAAASMAQVHRARLNGEDVVLKVLRPGIREQMAADIELMRVLGRLSKSYFANMGLDVEAVVEEFSRQLERETDLTIEARSTVRMREDFDDHEGITFPRVHEALSTRSVLVLEEIHGELLARLDQSTLTDERRNRIIQNGADMVFRQCLVIGFFHADPHPGNIFVLDDERLCFIDCGMTGLIDPESITQLAQLVSAAIGGDLNRVVKLAIVIADADSQLADDRAFRADVWRFVDQARGGSLESIQMGALLNEFFAVLRKYHLKCPSDIVYLIKALTTIEGVAGSIAPKFDLVGYVRPYVVQLVKQRYGLAGFKQRIEGALMGYGDLVEQLPSDLDDLMRAARKNRLALQLEHRGLDWMVHELDTASRNVSWSLVFAALIVGASVLVLADNLDREASLLTTIATLVFLGTMFAGVARMILVRWRPRKNKS